MELFIDKNQHFHYKILKKIKEVIMSNVSDENLYTREHEWVRIEGNKAEVGITDHAQKALGDIVFVDLPEIDVEIDGGDEFGSVESVKAVSSLFMPVSGRITSVNTELKDSPELINEECYDDGWMIRVELTNPDESADLLSSKEYEEFLLEEES